MTKEQITDTLTAIFRHVFEDPHLTIFPEMTAKDVEKWDSLSHLQMLSQVEKQFRIKLHFKEIRKLKNVGDLIQLIHQKVNAQNPA
jgi:acyl carrier protein